MQSTTKVVLVAIAAGALGLVASIVLVGPGGPLIRTELGQRALQSALRTSAPEPPAGVRVARSGEVVPAMDVARLDGSLVRLPEVQAGKPMLINLWASWCAPCVREMPELERFSAEQGANGVQVVGIALDDQAAVRAFLKRVPVGYLILIDQPGPADAGVRLGNPKGVLPYSVLLGADGRLLKQRIGPFADGEIDDWALPQPGR